MKIATRLFLYIATLIVLASIAFGYLSIRDERRHLMDGAKMTARTLSRTLAATFKYYYMEDQHQRLGELVHAVISHDEHVENLLLNIYDRNGQPISLSFEHGSDRRSLWQGLVASESLSRKGEQIINNGGHAYFSVTSPILNSRNEFQGTVEVLLSLDGVNNTVSALMRKFVLFTLLTSLLLGILLYLLSRWSISLPIARLKGAAKKLGHGDLRRRMEKSGVKELDDLIDEFNRMAVNIEHQNSRRDALFTEKLNLERGLRHQDKLASIGQLTTGLAHEIGTPLNVISGRAEHLLQKLSGEHPRAARNLKTIIRQAERIIAVMQQMLAFSRKSRAEFKIVSLEEVVREAFSLCQLQQRTGVSTISLELDLEVEYLVGDGDGLRQLFVNLMLNSFHAMNSGGIIGIRSEEDIGSSDEVKIVYGDTGPGVPPGLRDRIFDPFFTTKEVGEGTGLGLYMVSSIVQEHQGRIVLDSNPAVGACFILHLPHRPVAIDTSNEALETQGTLEGKGEGT